MGDQETHGNLCDSTHPGYRPCGEDRVRGWSQGFIIEHGMILSWYSHRWTNPLFQIEANDITAQISADGTVTFSDPPPQYTKDQVDKVLKAVQDQTAMLAQIESEVSKSKEFLNKVLVFLHWKSYINGDTCYFLF